MKCFTLVAAKTVAGRIRGTSEAESEGAVFVTKSLRPSDFRAISNCVAVICEEGDATCHLAVLCRISNIPVVRVENAVKMFRKNQAVLVDSRQGSVVRTDDVFALTDSELSSGPVIGSSRELQVSVVAPQQIKGPASNRDLDIRSVFLRHEFLCVAEDYNPFDEIKKSHSRFVECLADRLRYFANELNENCVLNFRSLDLRSDEFSDYRDDDLVEPDPQLGFRGICHLLQRKEMLHAELLALDRLVKSGFDRVVYSLPFVSSANEVEQVDKIRTELCDTSFDIGVFVETFKAIKHLQAVAQFGVKHFYVGTKDLASLYSGGGRGNQLVSHKADLREPGFIEICADIVSTAEAMGASCYVFVSAANFELYDSSLPKEAGFSVCLGELET